MALEICGREVDPSIGLTTSTIVKYFRCINKRRDIEWSLSLASPLYFIPEFYQRIHLPRNKAVASRWTNLSSAIKADQFLRIPLGEQIKS